LNDVEEHFDSDECARRAKGRRNNAKKDMDWDNYCRRLKAFRKNGQEVTLSKNLEEAGAVEIFSQCDGT
jgi:hypothetical protein